MKKVNKPAKKLTIAFLDFDDIKNPLLGAGQAWATFEVGKRLVAMGNKVVVYSSRYPGYKDRQEEGINYIHIGLGSKNIKLNNLVYLFAAPLTAGDIKADIIIECFTAPISTLFTPLFTKIPVVGLPTSFDAPRFSTLYHLPFTLIERFGCRFYKYFMPYTEYYDQKMRLYNPGVISKIIPEGVGEEYFAIKAKKPRHILYLGRFDKNQKGLDILFKAYAKIAGENTFPLIVAGKGNDEQELRDLVKQLNLNKYVRFEGPTYGEDKRKLLSETLYVVMPSRNEGFSLFSLEALAALAPLIVFDIPGFSWSNSKAVIKAKAFDVDEYMQLLKKYMDTKITIPLKKEARNSVLEYTWNNVANQFEDFFKTIIKGERL